MMLLLLISRQMEHAAYAASVDKLVKQLMKLTGITLWWSVSLPDCADSGEAA